MSAKEMKRLREEAGLTQAQMAERMGLGKTAYVDLETDDPDWKKFKPRHQLVLERVSLSLAIEKGNIGFALPVVRNEALTLATMIRGRPAGLVLEIQEKHTCGTAFLAISHMERLPAVGEIMTVTVTHHASFRKQGQIVEGTVFAVHDRGDGATIILDNLDPPLRPGD